MSSLRLAAIGDGLIGPLVYAGRGKSGLERSYLDNRFINWLRVILPTLDLDETAAVATPGATTVAIAERLPTVLNLDLLPQAMLISAGLQDCLAAIKGTAPPPDKTVEALEYIVSHCLEAGVRPILIVPPPCTQFSNGFFADRYVAIAATLRRLKQQDRRVGLIDATASLMKSRAFGIEPDPRYVTVSPDGRLSSLGAFRLAQAVANFLRQEYPKAYRSSSRERFDTDSLNDNPLLIGSAGATSRNSVTGRCATKYRLDVHQMGGALVASTRRRAQGGMVQRLSFSGRYDTSWGFVHLSQTCPTQAFGQLGKGDVIEAICDFDLTGPVANIAAVSLHATAVWDNDFVGLHSSLYAGGAGMSEPHGGRLRTPRFTLHAPVRKLHVSLQAHLVPGTDSEVRGVLDIHSIVVRAAKPAVPDSVTEVARPAKRLAMGV